MFEPSTFQNGSTTDEFVAAPASLQNLDLPREVGYVDLGGRSPPLGGLSAVTDIAVRPFAAMAPVMALPVCLQVYKVMLGNQILSRL